MLDNLYKFYLFIVEHNGGLISYAKDAVKLEDSEGNLFYFYDRIFLKLKSNTMVSKKRAESVVKVLETVIRMTRFNDENLHYAIYQKKSKIVIRIVNTRGEGITKKVRIFSYSVGKITGEVEYLTENIYHD